MAGDSNLEVGAIEAMQGMYVSAMRRLHPSIPCPWRLLLCSILASRAQFIMKDLDNPRWASEITVIAQGTHTILFALAWAAWQVTYHTARSCLMLRFPHPAHCYPPTLFSPSGTAMMLTAYPVGYLADKYLRSTVIAWGGFINLAALATLAFSVVDPYNLGKDVSFWILTVSMCLYGVGQGVVNGPAQALYAGMSDRTDRFKLIMLRALSTWMVPFYALDIQKPYP